MPLLKATSFYVPLDSKNNLTLSNENSHFKNVCEISTKIAISSHNTFCIFYFITSPNKSADIFLIGLTSLE